MYPVIVGMLNGKQFFVLNGDIHLLSPDNLHNCRLNIKLVNVTNLSFTMNNI